MSEGAQDRRRLWALGLLAVAAVLVAAVRLRLAGFPLERDEGEYAYFAQLILQGVPPYAEAYGMKLPGIHVAYAALLALFGQTAGAIRIGLLVVNLATMYLLFSLGRRLADEWTGAVAGAAFGLMSQSVALLGFAAHATHFVVLCAVGGLLLLLRAIDSGRAWLLVASGVLLGMAGTMKQHGIVFAAFGALWLAIESRRGHPARPGESLRRIAVYGAGAAAPFVAVLLAVALAGVFDRFWLWNFGYAGDYATSQTLAYGLDRLGRAIARMHPLAGFGLLAALGALVPLLDAKLRWPALFVATLLVFSALAVVPGFHFRAHYFIALAPAVALLAGLGVRTLALRMHPGVAVTLLAAASLYALASEREPLFRMSALEFSRAIYRENPFPEVIEIARYIEENSGPEHRVAVLGSEPEIFFYARRRSASGHLYMYPLMDERPQGLLLQREFTAEVESARPEFVVFVNVRPSWLREPRSARHVFDWGREFLERDYTPVGMIEVQDNGSRAVFGDAAIGAVPRSESYLALYRRKLPSPG